MIHPLPGIHLHGGVDSYFKNRRDDTKIETMPETHSGSQSGDFGWLDVYGDGAKRSQPVIRWGLFDAYKDLIVQILAMIAEQERSESKRRQAQGIAIAKAKGVYKGRPVLYSPNAKDPQKRLVYHRVVNQLKDGIAISQIAKEVGITRQTIYRIKKELNYFLLLYRRFKWVVLW